MANGTCSLDECDDAVYCRRWCKIHYNRWQRTGDPRGLRKKPNGAVLAALEEAGWSETDECIILGEYKARPSVNLNGTQMTASRAAWIIANGDPGSLFVLHTCHRGQEGCVNVRHLYLGDQMNNIADMDAAGRGSRGHGRRVLTAQDVEDIRRRHVRGVNHIYRSNTAELAAEFGVSKSAITNVVARRRWKAIEADDGYRHAAELERNQTDQAAAAEATAGAES